MLADLVIRSAPYVEGPRSVGLNSATSWAAKRSGVGESIHSSRLGQLSASDSGRAVPGVATVLQVPGLSISPQTPKCALCGGVCGSGASETPVGDGIWRMNTGGEGCSEGVGMECRIPGDWGGVRFGATRMSAAPWPSSTASSGTAGPGSGLRPSRKALAISAAFHFA